LSKVNFAWGRRAFRLSAGGVSQNLIIFNAFFREKSIRAGRIFSVFIGNVIASASFMSQHQFRSRFLLRCGSFSESVFGSTEAESRFVAAYPHLATQILRSK
jgi:hypothetical protein